MINKMVIELLLLYVHFAIIIWKLINGFIFDHFEESIVEIGLIFCNVMSSCIYYSLYFKWAGELVNISKILG